MTRGRKKPCRKNRQVTTGFSLVELMLSVVIISIITTGLGLALFHTKEKIKSYSVRLTSRQNHTNILRQIARDCRQATLIRYFHFTNKFILTKNTFPVENVSYLLDGSNTLVRVDPNSRFENLLSPVPQFILEPDTYLYNGTTYLRNLTIILKIGSVNQSETFTHTVSLLNHPQWQYL